MAANRAEAVQAPKSLNRKQAAMFLRKIGVPISSKTLDNMALNNNARGGPAFYKTGWRTVFYREEDLIAWASVRIRRVE